MRNIQADYNGKLFRYILSLIDVFSHFHRLFPPETKISQCGKKELAQIYSVHGILKRLESSNDGKFKIDVETFYIKKKIKMLRCHPYNPRVQGKVERSHRVLREKIHYDHMTHKKTGVNWVKTLM